MTSPVTRSDPKIALIGNGERQLGIRLKPLVQVPQYRRR
jgi:hypothetical protein